MKKAAAIIAALTLLFLIAVLFKKYEDNRANTLADRVRETIWSAMINRFQRDLPIGSSRSEVKKQLESGRYQYVDGDDIRVNLGQVAGDGFVCDYWMEYISFDFQRKDQANPTPDDKLRGISLKKLGHCL